MVQYKKREKRRHYFENFQLLQKVVNIEAYYLDPNPIQRSPGYGAASKWNGSGSISWIS